MGGQASVMDISEVKKAIANKTIVNFLDSDYIVTACIMRLRDDKWQYTLELKDLNANNSVVVVEIEKVNI